MRIIYVVNDENEIRISVIFLYVFFLDSLFTPPLHSGRIWHKVNF